MIGWARYRHRATKEIVYADMVQYERWFPTYHYKSTWAHVGDYKVQHSDGKFDIIPARYFSLWYDPVDE